MKRACIAVVLASTIAFSGCIGSFSLTNKLYSWNEKATDDRYVNSAIFLGMGIVQVYTVTLLVDAVVLNTIQFWGGKNPLAFTSPEKLEKLVTSNGKTFKVTMGNSVITVDRLDGVNAGRQFVLRYDGASRSYCMEDRNGVSTKIGSINGTLLSLYLPDGKVITQSLEGKDMQMACTR